MSDEPTRRLVGPLRPAFALEERADMPVRDHGSGGSEEPFARVSERPSAHPESFSEREGPTLASPNSGAISAHSSLEQRVVKALDRIQQLEADLKSLNAQVRRLGEGLDAERRRTRAARFGRYLLWGALITAMATFWMMLRLRLGSR
jgi:hypothetical protein